MSTTTQKSPLTKERFRQDMAEFAKEYEDCFSNKTAGSQAQQQPTNQATESGRVPTGGLPTNRWFDGLGESD